MSGITIEAYTPKQIIATTTVLTGAGVLGGIFVSSTSSGTIAVYDGTSTAGTKIIDTFSLDAGKSYGFSVAFSTGCHIVIGGTASITALYS